MSRLKAVLCSQGVETNDSWGRFLFSAQGQIHSLINIIFTNASTPIFSGQSQVHSLTHPRQSSRAKVKYIHSHPRQSSRAKAKYIHPHIHASLLGPRSSTFTHTSTQIFSGQGQVHSPTHPRQSSRAKAKYIYSHIHASLLGPRPSTFTHTFTPIMKQ